MITKEESQKRREKLEREQEKLNKQWAIFEKVLICLIILFPFVFIIYATIMVYLFS